MHARNHEAVRATQPWFRDTVAAAAGNNTFFYPRFTLLKRGK